MTGAIINAPSDRPFLKGWNGRPVLTEPALARLHIGTMAAVHWVEILKCHKCGRAGLAELWDHAAYEGHADIVPPGFRMQVVPNQGRAFFCIRCQVRVTPVQV